jgi:hypothetical protein
MLGETRRVAWDQTDPSTYDELVSVLLSRLHGAKRRDGSGGDGGRDCYFEHPGGTEVWQLKSFTGRLGRSQRRQVERSLERVRDNESPTSWTLVVPVDFNQSEEEWFATLAADCDFRCDWKGLTWLDEQMAEHPEFLRYYLLGADTQVIELLQQLREEQAGLVNGVPDAIKRMQHLTGLLDELSPHYRFDISIVDGTTSVALRTRYPGAEDDAPLRIHVNLSFPTTYEGCQAAEAFKDAMHFGRAVDLPREVVEHIVFDAPAGFGGESRNARISIGAAEERDLDLPMRLRLVNEQDVPIAELLVRFTERNRGTGGAELRGEDQSGMLRVEIAFDGENSSFTLHYEQGPMIGISPSALEPAVHFLHSLRAPARLVLTSARVGGGGPICQPIDVDAAESGMDEQAVRLVRALATLERHSHVQLEMPAQLSADQVREVFVAARLAEGETVSGTWSEVNADVFRERAVELADGTRDAFTMIVERFDSVDVCGVEIPLGTVRTHYKTARVADGRAVQRALEQAPTADTVKIKLVPADDDDVETRLLTQASE